MAATSSDALTTGFVLHRRDYSDTSLLVEVFTTEQGRFPLLAKGAKRGRAPRAAILQPFQPLLLAWSGRGEVRTLTRLEPAAGPLMLAGDALYCGFYLNELLMRLLERQDAHEALFTHYQAALLGLADGVPIDDVLRQFERRLLAELGYAPLLDLEADGVTPVRAEERYEYLPEQGLIVNRSRRESISGETLLALVAEQPLVGNQIREARRLLRQLLAPHLGERPLKSREFFRSAEQPQSPANRAG